MPCSAALVTYPPQSPRQRFHTIFSLNCHPDPQVASYITEKVEATEKNLPNFLPPCPPVSGPDLYFFSQSGDELSLFLAKFSTYAVGPRPAPLTYSPTHESTDVQKEDYITQNVFFFPVMQG